VNERDTRLRNRAALPRHRGHDAGLDGPRSDLVAADDYIGFCDGLRQISGIDLLQYRRPQMERRLRAYWGRLGISMLTDALPLLRRDATQLDDLLDRVTINVSQLWRHPDQWANLECGLLAELAARGPVRAWSAGCSYGAEPFTLAAVCRDAIPDATVRILGTDIDHRMIERANLAEFSQADARSAPLAAMERWFERTPAGWRAKPALRSMATFEVGDLLKLRPRGSSYELIMCRNTVIYFADLIRDELHCTFARALRPGGLLVVGGTERVSDPKALGLIPVRPFIYRKA
jgi:chemotaxis protein methyltransferase CheR